jgi:hypothetical protein
MFKIAGAGFIGFIFMITLNLVFYVGLFFGFMWVLEHFGIIEMIKEAIK